jgi:hypothetical protein
MTTRAWIFVAMVLALPHAASAQREARTSRSHYDHRAPEDHSADDAWRWLPQLLLAPFSLVLALAQGSTRLILEPIGPPPSSPDATEPAPSPLFAMPALYLESEMSAAIGAWVRIMPNESVRIDLGGQHADDARVEGWGRARFVLGDGGAFAIHGDASTRSDRIFHGIGDSEANMRRRYRHHRGGAMLEWTHSELFRSSEVSLSVRGTHHRFGESDFGGAEEPTLSAQDRVDGFAEGATVIAPRVAIAIDSRERIVGAGNEGVALEMVGGTGSDVEHRAHWTHAEARAEATVRLAVEHDLTVGVWAASLDPIAGAIPFAELAILGGDPGRLAGFPQGRLVGRTAAIASARYRWGIHQDIDAALHVELGNVFDAGFADFAIERGRLSVGLAIDGLAGDEHRFGALIALGTERIDRGAAIESGHVRFFVGSPPR